ncbi:CLUMA_CG021242, isoform A [Clunio marinus]|uniref:CLUMA_CG021242, isoform A n=1 Tax=Clunio marinus TaxID=568069 RepID=A0A1J1J7K1_9DIPT|nr:CLUMA_CG021242, isoform A [Clunio marinus]
MQTPVCKACVIPVCQNKKFSLVHKFPADKERFSEWMLSIQRSKPIEKLTSLTDDAIRKRYFVCARHFGLNEYKNVESRSLNLTAVPKFNLEDLSEMHLSKAWQLENSAAPCSEAFLDESDSIKIESPTKILNPSLKVNNKQNISLCRKTEIDTSPTNTSLPPTDIVDVTFKNNLDEPPTKKAKISNAVDITNLEKIKEDHSAIKKQPKVQHKAKDMSNKIKLMVKPNKNKDKKKISGENDKNLSLELKKEESHEESEDKGSNKLLALIEVTSDQYLQLSQSLSSEERNEKITTLLNFMTTNENDQNSSEQELKIKVDEDCSINLDLFWLRDHCRCEACYDHGNYQRKLNILNIPDDIKVSSYEVDNGKVSVIWSDGHESSYDIEFLLKNQPGATPLAAKEICLWNKEIIENPLKTN